MHRTRWARIGLWAPTLALLGAVSAWLWPIGLGGRMPVGGDVTQFALGLMAVLHRAISAGRLPLWNDLWGYGFPGVAESQMGVFYPPNLILYRLCSTEVAYTLSLTVHAVWAGLGAAWAARRFAVSPWGSALSGLAFAMSGFFLIHLTHHWAFTTGSWMPWAWGLAWGVVEGTAGWSGPWLLAIVLTAQVLPGHFQLAFCTQVGVLAMMLWALTDRRAAAAGSLLPVLRVAGGLLAVAPLAAMQLWPTLRLARLAESHRDWEYLSGFASSPLHLVSYVAPGLFHWSPLWRPVAWDPFHTSPEEHLAYLGLAPLFLAAGAIVHLRRQDRAVRVLGILVLVTLVLSLGPYAPGFSLWSALPGFSFFRAPARWSLATSLALALLAGKGFDALGREAWPRPRRSLVRFTIVAALAPLVVILGFELALASTEGSGWPVIAAGFDRALRLLPWPRDPSFRTVMMRARRAQHAHGVVAALARQGVSVDSGDSLRLSAERMRIYRTELGGTAAGLAGLLAIAMFARRRGLAAPALWVITLLDLWFVGRHRTFDLAPIRSLSDQSAVLARLAGTPHGTRTLDAMRNLPMVAGSAPVLAYRTLDLPVQSRLGLRAYAFDPRRDGDRDDLAAIRATGASVRIFDSLERLDLERAGRPKGLRGSYERIFDPALAGWLFGVDWLQTPAGSQARTFGLWWPDQATSRAWLLAQSIPVQDLTQIGDEPQRVLAVLNKARPLPTRSSRPEILEVEVETRPPAVVLVSQLDYPGWDAVWIGPAGQRKAPIIRVLGGWQGLEVPGAGRWTLRLEFRGRDVFTGLAVSSAAWTLGVLAFLGQMFVAGKRSRLRAGREEVEVS